MPVLLLAGAVVGLTALVALGRWFRRLILEDRSLTLALVLVWLVLVETVLYEPIDVPYGLFHLHAGGAQVRTLDLVFLTAIIARASVPGKRPFDLITGAWAAFAAWLTVEAFIGFQYGNSGSYIIFEYKTLLYLGLAYALGLARLDRASDLRTLVVFCRSTAIFAGLLLVTDFGHQTFTLGGGLFAGAQIGTISSIASSLFPMIGMLALALFLCSDPLRYELLFSALVLFATVLAPSQRASLLNLAISFVVFLVVLPLGRRHLRVTVTQVALGVAACIFVAGTAWVATAAVTGDGNIPYAKNVTTILHGGEKKLSAQDRVNQIVVAKSLIRQHPILGWGLGKTLVYYEVGLREFVTSFLSHNIITDLLIRTGAIGLFLFLIAYLLSLNDVVRCWRSAVATPTEAAFALAATAVIGGWFAHAMVESLFEHTRITPFAFVFLGLTRTLSRRDAAAVAEARVAGESRAAAPLVRPTRAPA